MNSIVFVYQKGKRIRFVNVENVEKIKNELKTWMHIHTVDPAMVMALMYDIYIKDADKLKIILDYD